MVARGTAFAPGLHRLTALLPKPWLGFLLLTRTEASLEKSPAASRWGRCKQPVSIQPPQGKVATASEKLLSFFETRLFLPGPFSVPLLPLPLPHAAITAGFLLPAGLGCGSSSLLVS